MKKIFLSYVVILFCISIMAQNSVNLKMNLEKNKVYRFCSSSEQTIIQTVNGKQQTIESKTNNTVSIKMIDATSDFLIAEVHFDTLRTKTNSMGKISSISSCSEGDIKSTEVAGVMSCIMNRLSKNAIYIKMDFSGKVIDVLNAKMLSDLIMRDTSSIALTGPMAAGIKTQIASMVSTKTLTTMVEMFTHYLPGKQVSTNETWNVTKTTNYGGMTFDIISDYHHDGVNGDVANITGESNVQAGANAAPMQAGGTKIMYDDIKGLSKSNMVLDKSTGLLIEEKEKTHIAGNLGISGPGLSMQMPMEINGESKVFAIK